MRLVTDDGDTDLTGSAAGARGPARFGVRSLLGMGGVVLGVVPFLLLWLLVVRSWAPLTTLDARVATGLNDAVSRSPLLVTVLSAVTDLGGTGLAVLVMTLATAFLLIRRRRRPATFVAVSGLGLAVLGPVTKAVVDRARPVVESPVVQTPSNASFPSGHSMTAVVVWGALLLVTLPSVRRRLRPWLVTAALAVVLAVGLTRLALGVHFVSDVLAGWALGAAWLAVTTAAFRAWQHERTGRTDEPWEALDVPPREAVHLDPDPDPPRPGAGTAVPRLLAAASASFTVLVGSGLLVTTALTDTWVGRSDRAVVAWFAELRSPGLSAVMEGVSGLAGARTVIAVGLVLAVLALAVTESWRPVVFVVTTLVGEVVLYWATSRVVDRARPAVADLTSGLPGGASWPSGHAAAAAALYGAAAALVLAHARGAERRAVLLLPLVLAPAVGVSRIYVAAHHPTDVLAGLALGTCWVVACALLLLRWPAPRGGAAGPRTRRTRSAAGESGSAPASAWSWCCRWSRSARTCSWACGSPTPGMVRRASRHTGAQRG